MHKKGLPPNKPKNRESTSPPEGDPAASITTLSSNGPLRVPTFVLSFDVLGDSSKTTLLAVDQTTNNKPTITLKENILLGMTVLN